MDVSNAWVSVYGRVKWVGKRVFTCQMRGEACIDVSSGWGSVYSRVMCMGKHVFTCQMHE